MTAQKSHFEEHCTRSQTHEVGTPSELKEELLRHWCQCRIMASFFFYCIRYSHFFLPLRYTRPPPYFGPTFCRSTLRAIIFFLSSCHRKWQSCL